MAAYLYPGIKSLQLVLDKPYDAIRTTDVRDDLASVKVWYSLVSGFNPNNGEGTLVPSGNSLSVIITGLTPNTRYYVKYAFVSAIDEDEVDPAGPTGPGSYTVSAQLTAVVFDENVTVYGNLTNDPVPIVTKADGTGGDFTNATGVFRVFNLSQEVTGGMGLPTGTGPVYAIKANSLDSLTGAVINATTGVYSCTGLTDDGGNVTFTATYNNIVVEQTWNVYRAKAGETAPLIQLSTPNKEFLYKDQFATSSLTPSTTITARLVNLTGTPTFTVQAFTREGTSLGAIAFTQATNTITITKAQFDALGVTIGTATVTATLGTVSDVLTIYRINDGSEQITVELVNESHQIPSYQDGTTTLSSYQGSGTVIQVKEGNTYLAVDTSSPFANGTWRITTIDDVNIVCDPTPGVFANYIEFDTHSAMDDDKDVAYIDYTITGKTSTGKDFTIVKRQSFAKSKEGLKGATARAVSIVAPGQIFITAKNTTTVSPASIVLTAIQSNFVNPTYTWLVDGVAPTSTIGTASTNTFTLNSFAAVGSKTVRVTVTETVDSVAYSEFDIFTVYSLREGDDAFIGGLSNENQTISCDSAGDPITGQFPLTSTFYAALGITFLTASTTPAVTFAKVSYSGSTVANDCTISAAGVITINALNTNSAVAVFTATINSGTANAKTITKELSLNKSKDGVKGDTGEGITQIYIRSTSNPPATPAASAGTPSGWYATVAAATGTDPLWTSFGSRAVNATMYTWQTPVRVEGTTVINPPLKNSTGYLYYDTASATAPTAPTASGYVFSTGEFGTITSGWSTTISVAPADASLKMWAVRYSVQETVAGGAQTVTISSVFTHQNFNGLVTFTNNTYATPSTVDTKITTATTGLVTGATVDTKISTATSGLVTGATVDSKITTAASTATFANSVTAAATIIDGAKITTGFIAAERLQIGKDRSTELSGNFIRMFDNRIIVYQNNVARVIIGDLS